MPNLYTHERWQQFRTEVIELDGGACRRCGRGPEDGAILQVHHLHYISGRLPWDYNYSDCETLCKGCHASEHGKIVPSSGWMYFDDEDLEELSGTCDCCGTEIRYVFYIQHPHWEPLGVGTNCCDRLTGTEIASGRMESLQRFATRRHRFLTSSRWKGSGDHISIRQKDIHISITKVGKGYRISMDHFPGKTLYTTINEAKIKAFEAIESGKAEEYLRKHKRRYY